MGKVRPKSVIEELVQYPKICNKVEMGYTNFKDFKEFSLAKCKSCGCYLFSTDNVCPACEKASNQLVSAKSNIPKLNWEARPKYFKIVFSIILGLLSVVLMCVPFISIPFVLIALPILFIPSFSSTGKYFEYIFLSVVPIHWVSWLVLTSYFALLWYWLLNSRETKKII